MLAFKSFLVIIGSSLLFTVTEIVAFEDKYLSFSTYFTVIIAVPFEIAVIFPLLSTVTTSTLSLS